MVQHEKKKTLYLWPADPDRLDVDKSQVLYKMKNPSRPVDRQHFDLPEEDVMQGIFKKNLSRK